MLVLSCADLERLLAGHDESVGFALEDLATATLAYNRAKERGIGAEVNL